MSMEQKIQQNINYLCTMYKYSTLKKINTCKALSEKLEMQKPNFYLTSVYTIITFNTYLAFLFLIQTLLYLLVISPIMCICQQYYVALSPLIITLYIVITCLEHNIYLP